MAPRPDAGATALQLILGAGLAIAGVTVAAQGQNAPGSTQSRAASPAQPPGAPLLDSERGGAGAALRSGRRQRGPGPDSEWSYGVDSRLTLSDNIGLAPPGNERSGTILEVSPFLRGEVNRPRLQASLDYALRNFYTTPDVGYEGPLHDLRGFGNAALVGDWLWLAGEALTYQLNPSPFGVTSADPASRGGNRQRYAQYGLSPYVQGWIGPSTSYRAGYAIGVTEFGDNPADSTAHQLFGRVRRDPSVHRLGWQASADGTQREFEDGSDYDTTNAMLLGLYRASPTLLVGAGANYSRISVVADDSGDIGGWGPSALLYWSITPRTLLSLQASKAYYGKHGSAALTHRTGNLTFALEYQQGIMDGLQAGLIATGQPGFGDFGAGSGAGPGTGTDTVADELGNRGILPGFGTPLASGLLGGALVENRRLTATVGWLRQRNAVSLTAFTNRSDAVQTTEPLPAAISGLNDLDQRGAILRYDRRLSLETTASLQGAFTRSESDGSALESDLKVFDAQLSRTFGRRTSGSIGYRRSEQSGSARYRENAILATLSLRF